MIAKKTNTATKSCQKCCWTESAIRLTPACNYTGWSCQLYAICLWYKLHCDFSQSESDFCSIHSLFIYLIKCWFLDGKFDDTLLYGFVSHSWARQYNVLSLSFDSGCLSDGDIRSVSMTVLNIKPRTIYQLIWSLSVTEDKPVPLTDSVWIGAALWCECLGMLRGRSYDCVTLPPVLVL